MLGGLIAGALGGGAAAVNQNADQRIQEQSKIDMARLEQQLAIERDEAITRRRAVIAREDAVARATGPVADATLSYKAREGEVEAKTAATRERAVGQAKTDVELASDAAYADPKNVASLKGRTAKADASESTSTKEARRASAAAAYASAGNSNANAEGQRDANRWAREERKLVDDIDEMRNRGDEKGAQRLEKKLTDLRSKGAKSGAAGAGGEPKSMADAVSAAGKLEDLAKAAEMRGEVTKAKELRTRAEDVLTNVTERRGVGAAPETKSKGPQEGQTGTSKSGKPIVFQNGQWVYK